MFGKLHLYQFFSPDVKETLSPLEKRSQSSEFVELSAEELESVPALVKGRVKLTDVNMVRLSTFVLKCTCTLFYLAPWN